MVAAVDLDEDAAAREGPGHGERVDDLVDERPLVQIVVVRRELRRPAPEAVGRDRRAVHVHRRLPRQQFEAPRLGRRRGALRAARTSRSRVRVVQPEDGRLGGIQVAQRADVAVLAHLRAQGPARAQELHGHERARRRFGDLVLEPHRRALVHVELPRVGLDVVDARPARAQRAPRRGEGAAAELQGLAAARGPPRAPILFVDDVLVPGARQRRHVGDALVELQMAVVREDRRDAHEAVERG